MRFIAITLTKVFTLLTLLHPATTFGHGPQGNEEGTHSADNPECAVALAISQPNPATLAQDQRFSWDVFLTEVFERGYDRDALIHEVAPLISRLPQETKNQLVEKIAAQYARLKKDQAPGVKSASGEHLAPRRAVDGILRYLINPNRLLLPSLREGDPLPASYDRYLVAMKKAHTASGRGGYNAKQVLGVLSIIQNKVKRIRTLGAGEYITVIGSFPMGSANLASSDIDMSRTSPQIQIDLEQLKREISDYFARDGIQASLSPSFRSPFIHENFGADLTPLVFRIYKDRIEALFFPEGYKSPKFKVVSRSRRVTPDRFVILN